MDLSCTVLMVEQVVTDGVVTWARFGLSVSGGLEVGAQTSWMKGCLPVSFAISDFQQALQDFEAILVASPI